MFVLYVRTNCVEELKGIKCVMQLSHLRNILSRGDLILCDPLLLSRNLCVKKIEIFKKINYLHSAFREEKVRFRKPIDARWHY